jgi:hypothetical protein
MLCNSAGGVLAFHKFRLMIIEFGLSDVIWCPGETICLCGEAFWSSDIRLACAIVSTQRETYARTANNNRGAKVEKAAKKAKGIEIAPDIIAHH